MTKTVVISGSKKGKLGRVRMEGAMASLHEVIASGDVPLLGKVPLTGTPHDDLNRHVLQVEATVLRACRHPGIVAYYGYTDDPQILFIERLPGPDIRMAYARAPLPLNDGVEVLRQILSALGHLHAQQWVHGDLKPENIVLDQHGHPVLVDLASAMPPPEGKRMGSPPYCPPEQLDVGARCTPSDDVYAAARILEFLTTGDTPKSAVSAEWLDSLPLWIAAWVNEATAPNRSYRYNDASEALRRLPPRTPWRRPIDWRLELTGGAQRAFPVRIGRATENDIIMSSPEVSRFQVTLEQTDKGAPLVYEHGRAPLIRVNGKPIRATQELREGDVLGTSAGDFGRIIKGTPTVTPTLNRREK